jgi:hypothetical protein
MWDISEGIDILTTLEFLVQVENGLEVSVDSTIHLCALSALILSQSAEVWCMCAAIWALRGPTAGC